MERFQRDKIWVQYPVFKILKSECGAERRQEMFTVSERGGHCLDICNYLSEFGFSSGFK